MRFKSCLSLFGFLGLFYPASDWNIFQSSVSFRETHIDLMNLEYLFRIKILLQNKKRNSQKQKKQTQKSLATDKTNLQPHKLTWAM
jgi:hypothetical protein